MRDKIYVESEIGNLEKILIHSPDDGIGKVVPSKAQDWLFEDIVHLNVIRKDEYDYYILLLLYFLDPQKIKGKLSKVLQNRDFFKPYHADFYNSDKVIEIEKLLWDILENNNCRIELIASVIALEGCPYKYLEEFKLYSPHQLAKTFISGISSKNIQYFPPIPNFIFTRDIGIVIKNYLILNKPAKIARHREALLAKYVFLNHPYFDSIRKNIIELDDLIPSYFIPNVDVEDEITLEGGDVMMISENHVLIGVSERTTLGAAIELMQILFEKKIVHKVTIIQIPKIRDYMHIDTIFTQVKRNIWVLLGTFKSKSEAETKYFFPNYINENIKEQTKIWQYEINKKMPINFDSIESLLKDISITDFKCTDPITIIYSGNDEYPYSLREQWTDSCNLLALKEGLVLGYDRNDKTIAAFKNIGFTIIKIQDLLDDLENDRINFDNLNNCFVMIPSAELSRARGGFHCMSMPLRRKLIN